MLYTQALVVEKPIPIPSHRIHPPKTPQASAGRGRRFRRLCRHLGLGQRLGAVQELGEAGHGLGRMVVLSIFSIAITIYVVEI